MSIKNVPCEIRGEPSQAQTHWALSVLALDKVPSSTEELHKIKTKLLAATHPDTNSGNPDAHAAFQRIGNAAAILTSILAKPIRSKLVHDSQKYHYDAYLITQKYSLLILIATYKSRLAKLVDVFSYDSFKKLVEQHPRADEIWRILNAKDLLDYAHRCTDSVETYTNLSQDILFLTEKQERIHAQRNAELTAIFNVIQRIRAYLFNLANQLYYPNLLASAYHLPLDECRKIGDYLQALEPFLIQFYTKDEILKKLKLTSNLKPFQDYLALETNLKSAYFKLQYKELVITACESLKNLTGDGAIWSSPIKFTSFSDFVGHCFADSSHQLEKTPPLEQLQPILDELVAEQPYSFVDLYLMIKCIRFAYQENVKKTAVINRFLTNYFHYFTHYLDSSLINFIQSDSFFATSFLAKKDHFTAALQTLIEDFAQQVDLSLFSTKEFNPLASDDMLQLQLLKIKLTQVLQRYQTYLDKNPRPFYGAFFDWFSHRTNIQEATAIINTALGLSNTQAIRKQVLDCLKNQQLGEAGQNDFRSYLLEAFVGDFSPSNFSDEVARLSNIWELPSLVAPAFVLSRGMN